MAKKETKVNYSEEDIAALREGYNPEASQEERDMQVKALADALGRNKQSIIAKLVNLKIYVKKVTIAKDGKPSMSKEKRVGVIASALGVSHEAIESLVKANVSVIKMVQEVVDARNAAETNLAAVMAAAADAGVSLESEDQEDSEAE